MYPRLRPPQRGQTKPFGHRCAVRCSPHWTSSPKRERNSLTVMMDFRFNGLGFFISDILSSFVRLFKLDIHLKLIMGIERPDAGTIRLDGVDVTHWPSHRISRAGIGIVFQRSRPLRRQTVLEHIKLALLPDSLWRVVADPSVDAKARQIAERVGLGGVIYQHPSALSYADLRRLETPCGRPHGGSPTYSAAPSPLVPKSSPETSRDLANR